jgi:hypothetical protein
MSRQQRVTSVAVHDMWQKIRFMKKKFARPALARVNFFTVFSVDRGTIRPAAMDDATHQGRSTLLPKMS